MIRRFVFYLILLVLVQALPAYAFQVTGTITGYSESTGLKYIYMIPATLDDFYIGIANILDNTYVINDAAENSYLIFAFQDVNFNLLPGLDEPRGYYGGQHAQTLELVSDTSGIDIELFPPQTGGFSGVISYAGADSGNTYIGAYDNPEFEGQMSGFGFLLSQNGNGNYTAPLPDSGHYYANCFLDLNSNLQRDPEEPYGVYGGIETPQSFSVSPTNWPDDIDMEMFAAEVPVDHEEELLNTSPVASLVLQSYPNPFNASAQIRYHLPVRADVTLEIFNIRGQRIATLVASRREAGPHTVTWDGRDDRRQRVASGIYLSRLRAGDLVETGKMLLLR